MEIIRAEILGFCSGVRRAVNSASLALEENLQKSGKVYSLGPLIHNPLVLEKFASKGLKVLSENEFNSLREGDTVIIRAHGVPPELEMAMKEKGTVIVNATCPLVTRSQKRAADFASKDYNIIFAGDSNHGEVIGIEGYARFSAKENGFQEKFFLIKDELELENLLNSEKFDSEKKTVLLSQTTFSIPVFEKIVKLLKEKIPDSEIVNSICPATHERQESLEKLCSKVDGVFVIGGKNSANTNRLFVAAQKHCGFAYLIESADEINEEMIEKIRGSEKIGITAGASTPDDVIEKIECFLAKIC